MTLTSPTHGKLNAAIEDAARLLKTEPLLAEKQLQQILASAPGYPPALLLLAVSKRLSGEPKKALAMIEPQVKSQPTWVAAHFEYSVALAHVGRGLEAIAALQKTVELKPDHPEAWRLLADHLLAIGDTAGSDAAYGRHIQCSTRDPSLQQAGAAMMKNEIPIAEKILKNHLNLKPTDVPAIRMLAEVAVRCGQNEAAENLLQRCLELAPGFSAARYNYAVLLHRQNDSEQALHHIEKLLVEEPKNPSYRNLCAVILSRIGEYERSSQYYADLLAEYPANAKVWLSYGHVLKTEGKRDACIDAYQQSIKRNPAFGEAYWSLANLKTFRFSDNEIDAMTLQLNDGSLENEDRLHLHFALGKALEDREDYVRSFENYRLGNKLHREDHAYDADLNTTRAQRLKRSFNQNFFHARAGSGSDSSAPIFIVGMPRSGSTLLEQILASHSQVEGTTELPDIITIAKDLREETGSEDIAAYADALTRKSATELRELGELYLERTRVHRKTDRRFFIDKMPNNFLHVGMIQVILPQAKIIDARRHPLGCCFSNFKQYYARGQSFSYSLSDMARFYVDYVDLMAHFDQALPGRVHRVHYEQTVSDTEAMVRKLLDYCGLEYEPGCLRFFENQRPVRTASSEQVRQPIYREGTQLWQRYEPWLEELKTELGEVLSRYPDTPESSSP